MNEAVAVPAAPDEMSGVITDEGIERYRARIGILMPQPMPFNTVATEDTMRHYAQYACGDNNPLFNDPGYAAKTRWNSLIAVPAYVQTMGITTVPAIPPEVRAKGAGALTGVPNYMSGSTWEFYAPIVPGDKIFLRYFVSKVEEKTSQFGGGRSVKVDFRNEYINQRDELVAVYMNYFFHMERQASEKAGKYMTIPDPHYDDAYLAKIDEAYEREEIRGANPRYWEDVNVGDALPTMVKGPLTATDIVCWHCGQGMGQFRVAPLKLGYLNRKRAPGFYTKNEFGVWDAAQRLHWEHARARRVGNPRAYDYARVRTQWLLHLLTNWCGDEGWVYQHTDQMRRFNYLGDTSWLHGKITKKYAADGFHLVDVEVWIDNQDGERTTSGHSTVILPTRSNPRVQLPCETQRHRPYPMEEPYKVKIPD